MLSPGPLYCSKPGPRQSTTGISSKLYCMIDSFMSNESKPFDLFLISPRRLLQQHWHKKWLSSRSKCLIFSTCIPQYFLVDYYPGQSNFHDNSSESFVHAQSRRFAAKKIQTVVFFFCIIWLF